MNADILSDALGGIDLKYVEQAEAYRRPRARARRAARLVAAVVAAALLLGLGTVGVASAVYGRSMSDLLGMLWQRDTGTQMSAEQAALIAGMSQEVGLSETSGGVTVTVTSARVSGYDAWLLLRVEGLKLRDGRKYRFGEVDMSMPDTQGGYKGWNGYTFVCYGIDGDGAAIFLINYSSDKTRLGERATEALDVGLTLRDFKEDGRVMAAGEWSFAFTLQPGAEEETMSLPDTVIEMKDAFTSESVDVAMRNIVISPSGYSCNIDGENLFVPGGETAVLRSGVEVRIGSGWSESNGDGSSTYTGVWEYPLSLDDIVQLRMGDTVIPVE